MTFDFTIETEDGDVVAILIVDATFSPYTPSCTDRRPEHCSPAEGGELEDLSIYRDKEEITDKVDILYGAGTYAAIQEQAKYHYKPYNEPDFYEPDYE